MNRILKVVFSRAKGMFVVVSELGCACSKSAVKSVLVTMPLVLASTGAMAAGESATDDPLNYFVINTSTNSGTENTDPAYTHAQAVGSGSLAIGKSSVAVGTSSYAFGQQARAEGDYSFALGNSAKAYAASSIAIGSSQARGDLSLAMGVGAQTTSDALRAIALGYQSVADSTDTVSVGSSTLKRKIVNVAKGNISENSTDAVTGQQLWATNQLVNSNTTQINTLTTTVSNHTDTIGNLTTKVSSYESSIGSHTTEIDALKNVQVDWTKLSGSNTNPYTDVETQAQNAIQAQARSAISLSTAANKPISVSEQTTGSGQWFIDLEMDDQVQDGSNKLVSSDQVFDAIAQAKSVTDNNLLIQATTQGATPSSDFHYLNNEWTTGQNLYALDQALYSVAMNPSSSTISVGNWRLILKASSSMPVDSGEEGLITGSQLYQEVRPTTGNYISQTNTTAENFSLLDTAVKQNADAITSLGGRVTATESGISALDGRVTQNATAIQDMSTTVTSLDGRVTQNATAIQEMGTTVTGLDGRVTQNANAIQEMGTTVTALDGRVTQNANAIQEMGTTVTGLDGRVTENANAIQEMGTTVTGIDGRVTQNAQDIQDMSTTVTGIDGRVTQNAQDIQVMGTTVTGIDGRVTKNASAIQTNAEKIAVNEGKIADNANAIQANTEMIGQNASNIQTLSNQVNKTYDKVQRVGAGAAALAALRPQDFSPEHPISGAVGLGHYDGKQAIAVGMYYRPTENLTVGFGASAAGNDDYMMNAGISYRFGGSGTQLRLSQSDINRKVVDLTDQNRALVAQIESSNIREEASAKRLRAAEKKAELSEQKLDMVMKELAALREEIQKLKQK